MKNITVSHLAALRLFHERVEKKTNVHLRIFEFMVLHSEYYTSQEVAKAARVPEKFTETVLLELAEKRLLEKEGCLFRCKENIAAEVVGCK